MSVPPGPDAGRAAAGSRTAGDANDFTLAQAERILAGGQGRYIFRVAFLRIWLPLTLVAALLLSWLAPGATPLRTLPLPPALRWIGLLIPGAAIASIVWGRLLWQQYHAYWAPRVAAAAATRAPGGHATPAP